MSHPELTSNDEFQEPMVVLSEKDVREAARLLRVLSQAIDDRSGPHPAEVEGEDLALRARIILNSRRHRLRFFSRSMFGEPAWDILLVLFATERSEGRQPVGRLAEWIDTPLSTTVRWIDYLTKRQLVERTPHPTDKRIMFVKLADKGRELLEAYLRGTPWDLIAPVQA